MTTKFGYGTPTVYPKSRWYDANSVIRARFSSNSISEVPLLNSGYPSQILNMSLSVQVLGIKQDDSEPLNIQYCAVGWVLVILRKGDTVPQTLDFDTWEDRPEALENAPLYTGNVDQVIMARNMLTTGYLFSNVTSSGFQNASYPGPIQLEQGDRVSLLVQSHSPNGEVVNPEAFVVGNLSYSRDFI